MNTFVNKVLIVVFVVTYSSCQQPKNDLPCIDVRKNYLEKDIFLTDIADISYLCLNSDNDDYLYGGGIAVITESTVVVTDNRTVWFFNIDGTPKSRFNHLGNGPKEYRYIRNVFYDEAVDDVFVVDDSSIQVYSYTGIHKREIMLPQGVKRGAIVSFDHRSFFLYDASMEAKRSVTNEADLTDNDWAAPFYLISKANGDVLDHFTLPVTTHFLGIYWKGERISGVPTRRLVKSPEGAMLCNAGTDTIFLYNHDKSLIPVLSKTPSVQSLNPMEYFDNCLEIGQYQYIKVIVARAGDVYPGRFPAKYYVRNKKTGEVFFQKFLLPDYQDKEFIISHTTVGIYENGCFIELDLSQLKQAYVQNKLSGKLKELVATLKEDDNNVYVIAEFK